jgi:hypothetical protein
LDFANNRGFVRGVGQGGAMDAVTFTRASNATYVNDQGLLVTHANQGALGNNLLTFPQDFDNAAWTKQNNASITPNQGVAIDGTNSADLLSASGLSAGISQSVNLPSSGTYTFSVYIQNVNGTHIALRANAFDVVSTADSAWFDIENGTIGTVKSGVTANISSAGFGIYRCSITFSTSTDLAGSVFLYLTSADNSFTASAGQSAFIWGAQLELGSTATEYYPTNIGQPRFDWASTAVVANRNLLTRSEILSYWATNNLNATLATDVYTAPDGFSTADQVVMSAAGYFGSFGSGEIWGSLSTSGTIYTGSIFLKDFGGGATAVSVTINAYSGTVTGTFNLVNGTASNGDIQSAGDGWYRCAVTSGPSTSSLGTYRIGTAGAYTLGVWGFQFETSLFATPYLANGVYRPSYTPLAPAPTCNGLLIEESRTNRLLWCRDASQTPNRNLLAYSEQLDNAYWTKLNVTISADATAAPDSTSTADKVIPSSSGTLRAVYKDPTSNAGLVGPSYTTSVYAKKGEYDWCYLYETQGNRLAYFNINTGVVGTVSSGATATITNIGSGWYRLSITSVKTTTNSPAVYFGPCDANASTTVTASGTNGTFFWGVQIDLAGSASTYERTTVASAIWSKQGITATKDQAGVDRVSNAATSLTASAANGTLIQPIALASGSRTSSVYLKRITGTGTVQVSLDGSTWSTVELSTSEWRRVVLSGTVTNPVVGVRIAVSGDAVAMDYGQVEDGAFATSPVLTTGATATRAVDIAVLNFAQVNSFEGTFKTTFNCYSPASSARVFQAINQGIGITLLINNNAGTDAAVFVGTNLWQIYVPIRQNSTNTVSITYNVSHDHSVSSNGVAVSNDRSPIIYRFGNSIAIGGTGVGNLCLNGTIKSLIYFPNSVSSQATVLLSGGAT